MNEQRTNASLYNERWMAQGGLAACVVLFAASPCCEAQNLVPNPSFEEIDSCPQWPHVLGYQPGARPTGWYSFDGSPDYFTSCAPAESPNGVPYNTFGFQEAHDGGSYSGMAVHLVGDYREMIGAELLEPLTIGQTYYGSFWVNAAYGGPQQTGSACNNTGLLFTMEPNIWNSTSEGPPFTLRNYAQIHSQEVISDTAGWTLVSGSFVADSAYQFIVLGNHFSNANTTVQILGPGTATDAYVYVDGLCLSTDPDGCPMITSIRESSAGAIGLRPNPASTSIQVSWSQWPVRTVALIDATGRRLAELHVTGRTELVIPVHHLPNGIYHLLLEGDGTRYGRTFVVMR